MKPSQNIKVVDVRQTYEDFCEATKLRYRVFEDSNLGRSGANFQGVGFGHTICSLYRGFSTW